MDINLQTKVAALLDRYPDLEQTLFDLSPVFAKLKNPLLRRTVAKVTTLQQAAKIAGISPEIMVQALRETAGLAFLNYGASAGCDEDDEKRPAWLDENRICIRFDACPIIEMGDSPLGEIIRLSKRLKAGEIMELSSPFKPVPVIDLLKLKNFQIWYNQGKTYICCS